MLPVVVTATPVAGLRARVSSLRGPSTSYCRCADAQECLHARTHAHAHTERRERERERDREQRERDLKGVVLDLHVLNQSRFL